MFDVGGQVRARTTATLVSKLFAEVQEILVQPGDKVRAGQVLVRLDGRDLQAQRAQAEAGVAAAEQGVKAATTNRDAAEAGLALASATHRRIAELRAKNSATPHELDQAVSALKAAESHAAGRAGRHPAGPGRRRGGPRRAAGATVGASYAVITAPFDGVVTEKRVELGNMATPGTPAPDGRRRPELPPRGARGRVARAARSTGAKPVEVVVDSLARPATTPRWPGTISEVSRAIDGRARLPREDRPARRTRRCARACSVGRASAAASRQALTVPASAVVRRGQLTSVFVVGEDNRARLRLVQVAPRVGRPGRRSPPGSTPANRSSCSPPPALVDGAPVRARRRRRRQPAGVPAQEVAR